MAQFNKQGHGANTLNTTDIVAHSISVIRNINGVDTIVNLNDIFVPNSNIGSVVAPVNNPVFTGNVGGVTAEQIGLGNVDNTRDLDKQISTATQIALNLKADKTSLNKIGVGLNNVDNTTDLNKPISTLTQSALDLKANLTSLNKTNVGLGNVDNTTDLNKPVSTATATAISTAISNLVGTAPAILDTLGEIATSLGNNASLSTSLTTSITTAQTTANTAQTTANNVQTSLSKYQLRNTNLDNFK